LLCGDEFNKWRKKYTEKPSSIFIYIILRKTKSNKFESSAPRHVLRLNLDGMDDNCIDRCKYMPLKHMKDIVKTK